MNFARKLAEICLAGIWICAVSVQALEPERAVPADAAYIVKIRDVGEYYNELVNSKRLNALLEAGTLPEVSAKMNELTAILKGLEEEYGFDLRETMDNFLGREVIIAGAIDGPAVFATRGHSAESLQKAVLQFQKLVEAETGSVTSRSDSYKGMEIETVSQAKNTHSRVFYKDLLLASEEAKYLRQVIDVLAGDADSLMQSVPYRKALKQTPADGFITCYVDVSAFWSLARVLRGSEILKKMPPKARNPWTKYILFRMSELLPRIQSIAFSLHSTDRLTGRLHINFIGGKIPEELKTVFGEKGMGQSLPSFVPQNAVLAASRRVKFEALWDDIIRVMGKSDPAAKQRLERGIERMTNMIGGIEGKKDFFEQIGEQITFFALARRDEDKFPAAAVALELRKTEKIPNALRTLMGALAILGTAENEEVSATLQKLRYKEVPLTVTEIEANGPAGQFSPTLFVMDKTLFLTSDVTAAHSIVDTSKKKQKSSEKENNEQKIAFGRMRLDMLLTRAMLEKYRAQIIKNSVKNENKTRAQAEQELAALKSFLILFKELDLEAAYKKGQLDFNLTSCYSPLEAVRKNACVPAR
ncbi:MAG: DUF3352 domain-containing protein [Candidatus Brocadiia bacterium]